MPDAKQPFAPTVGRNGGTLLEESGRELREDHIDGPLPGGLHIITSGENKDKVCQHGVHEDSTSALLSAAWGLHDRLRDGPGQTCM